ncbi:SDR family oxidoreductase [Sphingobium sp. CR2-8]|uniref:SDR family NAD(P)-dependent oxidoreductase n=1 Tax=Sphingobium sp. CR2-8 TaxID=1306534 RepID=UPI002DB8E795|nr:SDR family oxidoreductase [Sphingobium sp. CR2-8]MEC3909393.1 SDR family oxidoreductase [Sphingobium sp. CR2-8]
MTAARKPDDLAGNIILVTGAKGAIGNATVASLAAAGATVVPTDIVGEGDVLAHDVTSLEAWQSVAAHIEQRHGQLDGLVHNAGISFTKAFAQTSIEDWRKVQTINVESVVIGTQAMLPLLMTAGAKNSAGASIVILSSIAGLRGSSMHAAYCASKGAVKLLAKSLANEFADMKLGIRVNTVHPGPIEGAMMEHVASGFAQATGLDPEKVKTLIDSGNPMGRMGKPEEVAHAIQFLCSDGAAFITGTEISVDGGASSR